MKNANRNDQGKSSQQSYPKEDTRNRGAEKRPGALNIRGATPEELPAEGNAAACEDDPLPADDIADQIANEVDSARDEARARGEIR